MGQAQTGKEGVYTAEGQRRKFRRPPDGNGKEIGPTVALVSLPPKPKGGTYFLGTGYLGPNSDPSQKAYPVYLTGFQTLDEGVSYQVNILLRKWNQAANAKTVEEYAEGLRHPPTGWPYFQADPGAYKKGLSSILAKYQAQFGDQPLGIVGNAPLTPPEVPSPVGSDAQDGNWAKDGSKEAGEAKKQFYKLAGSTFSGFDLGKRFTDAQRAQISLIQQQLDSMHKVPPLRLIVNPANFSVKGAKIISDANWGRNGPITHHWGDDQDKISASGKVAGFYAIDKSTFTKSFGEVAGVPGLARSIRNYSKAWQNLQSLYLFYKNNGGMWLQDRGTSSKQRNLTMVGSVYIYYDNILYIGSFDTFNITEADTAPFTAEYNFEFTVRAAFLLDRPDLTFSNVSRDARAFREFNNNLRIVGEPASDATAVRQVEDTGLLNLGT
jgi:hypothetical protein